MMACAMGIKTFVEYTYRIATEVAKSALQTQKLHVCLMMFHESVSDLKNVIFSIDS
jgi:hypothetical protein